MRNFVREKFEAYASANIAWSLRRSGDGYAEQVVMEMWDLWQASHRATQQGEQ